MIDEISGEMPFIPDASFNTKSNQYSAEINEADVRLYEGAKKTLIVQQGQAQTKVYTGKGASSGVTLVGVSDWVAKSALESGKLIHKKEGFSMETALSYRESLPAWSASNTLGIANLHDQASLSFPIYINANPFEVKVATKLNHIPVSAPHVVKRQIPLEKLHSTFFEKLQKLDSPVVAIVGNPLEGKTVLAKQYADQFKEEYHHRWFVQTENWEGEYRNLARKWGLFFEVDKLKIEVVIDAVHRLFSESHVEGRKKSLIVFDNASAGFIFEKLKMQLPSNTHILITSRDLDWENRLSLSDEEYHLTSDEGIAILHSCIEERRFDLDEAKTIVRQLGHSTAVIANAGSYLAKNSTTPMKGFLPLFEKDRKKVLEKGKHSSQDRDIVTSLNLIIDQLPPKALELLHYCVYLPGKNIPTELLMQLMDVDEIDFNDSLNTLGTLVVRDTDQVTIHDLFQDLLGEDVTAENREKYLSTIAQHAHDFERFLFTHRKKAHLIYEQGLKDAENADDFAEIYNFSHTLGEIFSYYGDFEEAIKLEKKALKASWQICSECGDELLGATATSYSHLADLFYKLDDHEKALKWKRMALDLFVRILGPDHPTIAACYIGQGKLLEEICQFEEAIEHYQKGIEVFKKNNNEHAVAASFLNLADCLLSMNKSEEASKYLYEAKHIFEQVLGKDHRLTVVCYTKLFKCLTETGKPEEALDYLEQATEISTKVFGNNDITGMIYSIWATHSWKSGEQEKALDYSKKALNVFKEIYGDSHPNTIASYSNTGSYLTRLGRIEEALAYVKKAVIGSCRRPQEDHFSQTFLKQLIMIMDKLSNYRLCIEVREEVLPLAIEKLGIDEPLVKDLQKTCVL